MATNGPQTQAILDIKSFIDNNLESYVQAYDAALTAPESKLGERNAFGAQRYPIVMFVPGPVTNSYSGNYGYESDIEIYIGIAITNPDPAALITALWRYIDAMTELAMSDPSLGGVCIESGLEDAEPIYGDPQAKNVGLVIFTLRGVIEVQT
ncbi:MAG: hypothetical protein ACLFS5_01850 [Spirochaetaceae bacterium]